MDIEKIFNDARNGDDYAISILKNFLKDGQALLENLYYDGNKEHAVGTITLRDGITEIEDYAFEGCDKLEKIKIPDSVISIGNSAFWGCSSLKEVNFPKSLNAIAEDAFCGCKSLKEITLPDNLTSIAVGVFSCCKNLKKINFPDGLDSIDAEAFYGCESLKEIDLPDGLTSIESGGKDIGHGVFQDCINLQKVYLPDSLTQIGEGAFWGCTSLREINLPDGLTYIGAMAFEECKNLKEMHLPDGLTYIWWSTFEGCERLEEIYLPESVTEIMHDAFSGCENLTEIFLPVNLNTIGESAFRGCKSLEEINLPDNLTEIKDYTFYGCSSLTEIKFPENLKSIGGSAFSNCNRLKKIYYHKKTEENLKKYFVYKWDELEKIVIDEQENLYYDGKRFNAVGTITLRKDITSIEDDEFRYCGNLEKVNLPEGLTSIGERAFLFCKKLKEINLPEGLTSIGYSAFLGCESLEKIYLPESLNYIGYNAFSGCKNLKKIIYHKKTEEFLQRSDNGQDAFGDKWNELEKIVVAKRRRVIVTDLNNEFVKFAQSREIKYFVHFTRAENLPNISRHGLLTRKNLDEMSMEYLFNDDKRLDNVTDSLSLSVTFPNYQIFYRWRLKTGAAKWAVILLDAGAILSNFPCAFNYTNAAAVEIKNLPLKGRMTLDAFKNMFYEPTDFSRANRNLSPNETTDPQAEILCLKDIPIECIANIMFYNQKSLDEYQKLFPNTSCNVDRKYFTYRHDWNYWKKYSVYDEY